MKTTREINHRKKMSRADKRNLLRSAVYSETLTDVLTTIENSSFSANRVNQRSGEWTIPCLSAFTRGTRYEKFFFFVWNSPIGVELSHTRFVHRQPSDPSVFFFRHDSKVPGIVYYYRVRPRLVRRSKNACITRPYFRFRLHCTDTTTILRRA